MGDTEAGKCEARARHKVVKYGEPHTFPCQLDAGHEGAHLYKRDERTVMWFGDSQLPDNTRLRFGRWLEAK